MIFPKISHGFPMISHYTSICREFPIRTQIGASCASAKLKKDPGHSMRNRSRYLAGTETPFRWFPWGKGQKPPILRQPLKIMRLNDLEVSEVLVVLGYISWVLALTHLKHRWEFMILIQRLCISFYLSIFLSIFLLLSIFPSISISICVSCKLCVDPAASERFTHLEVVKPWVPKGPRSMAPATNLRQASCWINRSVWFQVSHINMLINISV